MKIGKAVASGNKPPQVNEDDTNIRSFLGFNASHLKMDGISPPAALDGIPSSAPQQPALSKVDINNQVAPTISRKKNLDPVTNELRNYVSMMDEFSLHNFIIWNGRALRNTPEFASYQRTNVEIWSSIISVIVLLETLLTQSNVKMAIINGQKLAQLAVLNLAHVSKKELFACMDNEEQVRASISRINADSDQDKLRAIMRIQTCSRKMLAMKSVKLKRLRIAMVFKIQCAWRIYVSKKKSRILAKQAKDKTDQIWNHNQNTFIGTYGAIRHGQSRLIIFLPTISASEYIRVNMEDINGFQNASVSIFHQLLNPDISIVYISPVPSSSKLLAYHEKLLTLLGAPEGAIKRLRVLTPEMSLRLPDHTPVGTALWYSSATLRKLRSISRKYAHSVFVPASCSFIEKRIANFVRVGTLSCDPIMASMLSTRSHAKRVFIQANVNVPIGAHDIESEDDLIIALSRLIACNLDINRWFLRLNSDFNGESLCILDASKMPVVISLREEQAALLQANHFNSTIWFEQRIQISARKRIVGVFHHTRMQVVEIIRKDLYPNWIAFLQHIRRRGCIIEAEPASSLGYMDCVCLIEPPPPSSTTELEPLAQNKDNGGKVLNDTPRITILDSNSLLVDDFGQPHGRLYPPCHGVPLASSRGATEAVARVLWKQIQCIGFVTVRFLVSWDHQDDMSRLLATELIFGLTPSVSGMGTAAALRLVSTPMNHTMTAALKVAAKTALLAVSSPPSSPGEYQGRNTGKGLGYQADNIQSHQPVFKFSHYAHAASPFFSSTPLWTPSELSGKLGLLQIFVTLN